MRMPHRPTNKRRLPETSVASAITAAAATIIRSGTTNPMSSVDFKTSNRRGLPLSAALQGELDRILGRFTPSHIIIDDNHHVVRFHGNAGRFLELAPGQPDLDLLTMARKGLVQPLRTILRTASRQGLPARRRNIKVRTNGGIECIDVEVAPLAAPGSKAWFVVVLTSTEAPEADDTSGHESSSSRRHSGHGAQLSKLRRELAQTREALRLALNGQELVNAEMSSTNEEVKSANEELESINEELEASREQMQSSNDELMSVNEELQKRSLQLAALSSELSSLVTSLRLAVVIVDKELRIKRFTAAAAETLHLIPTDLGRPISKLDLRIPDLDLQRQLRDVVETGVVKHFEVLGKNGDRRSFRLRPYVCEANTIEGGILTVETG